MGPFRGPFSLDFWKKRLRQTLDSLVGLDAYFLCFSYSLGNSLVVSFSFFENLAFGPKLAKMGPFRGPFFWIFKKDGWADPWLPGWSGCLFFMFFLYLREFPGGLFSLFENLAFLARNWSKWSLFGGPFSRFLNKMGGVDHRLQPTYWAC